MKKKFLTSIIVITFILAGCGTPQAGNGYTAPQQINEPTIAEITPVYETQIERVNNCDGANPTYNISYKTIEAQKASFEVSVSAGGLVTGTPIPPVLEAQLEAKITAALAKDYGLTTEKNHDLTLDNAQGTFLEHTITWKVTRVKGLIEVVYGDGIAQVGFEKIADVVLHDRTSKSLGCDGQNANTSPSATELPSQTVTSGTVLLSDDFEQGISNWKVGQGWEMRSDTNGNHFFCVTTSNSDYSYIYAGSPSWENYALSVRLLVEKLSSVGSINVDIRSTSGNHYSGYTFDSSQKWSGILKEEGPPYTNKSLAGTSPKVIIGEWQTLRFEVKGSQLAVFLNNELILQGDDDSLKHGSIVLGAGGTGMDVCFDDVTVTALEK